MSEVRARWLAVIVLSVTSSALGSADDAGFLDEVLRRPIIRPALPQAEVRSFVEERVAPIPRVRDQADWERQADKLRAETLRRVIFRGEAARWRQIPTKVEYQGTIPGGPGYQIQKLRYEVVPGFWVPALLYRPEKLDGKVPAVVNFDGHDPLGMFAPYKQVRCINLARRGMIALNVDWIGMGQLRTPENQHAFLNHLDLCGTSGLAVFALLQTRAVDVLLAQENTDPTRVAATGLSGGGWQTIFLGAMDPRVSLIAPVAGYSSFLTRAQFGSDLGDAEQTPVDLATIVDYTTMTAMLAPRPALLTFNARDDCCFAADHALPPLLEAARPIYQLFGKESHLRTHVNRDPGTHNYLKDNREAFYRMLGDHFFPGRTDYPREEFAVDDQVQTPEQLRVNLPPENATLRQLAENLARTLPRDSELPVERPAALDWQSAHVRHLAEIVGNARYTIRPETAGSSTRDGLTANRWTLKADLSWTIPAVELSRVDPKGTTLLILDAGRTEAGAVVGPLLSAGQRVIVLDLFDMGESKILDKAWLWHLYVSTVGKRSLGIQAAQLGSIARWVKASSTAPLKILAIGPRATTAALVATALEPDAIGEIELRDAVASFKEPIEASIPFDKAPDRFCFGLLERFDIPQLVALIAPRPVVYHQPSSRIRDQLAGLRAWYKLLGRDFAPTDSK